MTCPIERRPHQLYWTGDSFCLNCRFMLKKSHRQKEEQAAILKAAEEGIREIYTTDFPFEAELIKEARRYLDFSDPKQLASFDQYVDREVSRAERSVISHAAALLKEAECQIQKREALPPLPAHLPEPDPRLRLSVHLEMENPASCPLFLFFMRLIRRQRRFMILKIRPCYFLPAHVNSSFFRRFWGLFRDGRIISMGFNWSPGYPGIIYLPDDLQLSRAGRVAAHELGHGLGLGDAYGAWYRFYDPAPGTQFWLMRSNGYLHAREFQGILKAQRSGQLQHFPYRRSWRRFREGLRREVSAQRRRLEEKTEHER